ncbi:MAG: primosomal protein N' [Chloroflexi bacterium]|nr:primosomal protein N' [Chloroflexota bacterium]
MQFAEVAVDFPDDHSRTFTYSIPEDLGVVVGDLVWVPFGPRTVQGVVFEITSAPATEVYKIRPITARTIDGPFINEHLIRVARWVAEHYRTALFTACSLQLPPGASSRLRTWLLPGIIDRDLTKRERQAVGYVMENDRAPKKRVVRRLGLGGTQIVDRLMRQRIFHTESDWEKPRVTAVYSRRIELAATELITRELVAQYSENGSRRRAELLEWFLSGKVAQTKSTLISQFGSAAVKWAFDEELLKIRKIRRDRDPLADYFVQQEFAHSPTEFQRDAIEQICTQILANRPSANPTDRQFLLHGVTGSGKTEVYLQAIETCIAAGKQAIFLVPEIALTPQTLQRIASRFPGKVGILHSGLTVGQRYDQWWRVKKGDFPIVLGSRGAVFAPIQNPGLIVIDEEHEWTYKQSDQTPRYDARAVAERISNETGATLVLGSATPDVSSYRSAKSGRYRLLKLPDRVISGHVSGVSTANSTTRMAKVEIVDMRDERSDGHFEMLSRRLIDSMRDALQAGGKVILFLNRRGSASFIQCMDCGQVRRCKRCDTSLTFHRDSDDLITKKGKLVCHYCNYTINAETKCPSCGGKQMHRSAPGTQMATEMVRQYFPGIEVVRWDSDNAKTAADHQRIMDEFVNSEAGVLVGTQMVAKGLDIPSVTLVGVISADTGLAVPDFRASERAFQVLAQVIGRSGRGAWDGRAIIQTFNPDHYAILAAADQDYELFYDTEIRLRASQANPPFTSMIKLTHSAGNVEVAQAQAERMAITLKAARESHGETGTEVLGPTPGYPLKMRNMYRWQILLKGAYPERLLELVPPGLLWAIDVDPA